MEISIVLDEYIRNKDNKQRICLRIFISQDQRKRIKTPYLILAKNWDAKKCRAKSTEPSYLEINEYLEGAVTEWKTKLKDGLKNDIPFELLTGNKGLDYNNLTLSELARLVIKKRDPDNKEEKPDKTITKSRLKIYEVAADKIEYYESINGPVYIKKLDRDFFDKYRTLLYFHYNLGQNTVRSNIKTLKTFLNYAEDKKYPVSDAHTKKWFKEEEQETDAIYLTTEEIELIEKVDLSAHPHLESERERFLPAYNFLLRYSDSVQFQKHHFFQEDGRWIFTKRTQKTKAKINVPVKPSVYKILEKRGFSVTGDTNVEANWKIKEIGKLAGITQDIELDGEVMPKYKAMSTHTARRSGATNLLLAGVPQDFIMKLGGWKDVTSFRKYIRINGLDLAKHLQNHAFFS